MVGIVLFVSRYDIVTSREEKGFVDSHFSPYGDDAIIISYVVYIVNQLRHRYLLSTLTLTGAFV
jgi:hypothetical protein